MMRTTSDPCFLVRRSEEGLEAIVVLEVYDSLRIGTYAFRRDEEGVTHHLKFKPRTTLSSCVLDFNGADLYKPYNSTILMRQLSKIVKSRRPTT